LNPLLDAFTTAVEGIGNPLANAITGNAAAIHFQSPAWLFDVILDFDNLGNDRIDLSAVLFAGCYVSLPHLCCQPL
jgi:hypothetical protein